MNTEKKDADTYAVRKVQIDQNHELYEWCSTMTSLSNNLYNTGLFHIRQCMTGLKKEPDQRQPLEKEVIGRIEKALPDMNLIRERTWQKQMAKYEALEDKNGKQEPKLRLFKMPEADTWMLSFTFLDALFKTVQDPDYLAKGLPRQSAQAVLKRACQDMKSFFEASKEYKANPSAFLGAPRLPGYKKRGGQCTAIVTSQDCVYDSKENAFKLPLTGIRLKAGETDQKLKQLEICPSHGIFVIHLTFETDAKPLPEKTVRAAALDPGLNNFASIVTNSGSKGLIVKGGAVQNAKRHEQYRASQFQSGQCGRSKKRFAPSKRYHQCIVHYENQTKDLVSKTAVRIMEYLKENKIDTLIVGHNKNQKQNINIGTRNNQKFCSMPVDQLRRQLEYRCQREGILYLETEESYTSKSSFLDGDILPVYGDEIPRVFSGRRTSRGQYVSKDGKTVNADLNGAANIGRKLFPELFTPETVSFEADVWRIQSVKKQRSKQKYVWKGKKQYKKDRLAAGKTGHRSQTTAHSGTSQ